jgi:membrane associated rhomboid family serine protease
MIPLRDNIPPRTFPFVNYLFIALCSVAFLAQLAEQTDGTDGLIERLGMIPARVFHPKQPITIQEEVVARAPSGELERVIRERTLAPSTFSPWWTLLTCTFLHGGWMHILGNMWFLHIFGDNVEDRFGHVGYLIFYLASGVLASATHLLSAPESTVPTIGASGAIAGVMGAYCLLYPRAKVLTIVPIFVFIQTFVIPAPFFLGVWFLMQLYEGSVANSTGTGVAWWAHIGGFAVGFVAAWLLEKTGRVRPPVTTILPNTERMSHYRYRRIP